MHPPARRLAAALLPLLLAACGGGGGDPVEPPPPPSPTAAAVAASSGGAAQTATVGTAVAAAPAVRVTSSGGQPVAGVAVSFAVTAGGGSLGATAATTDAQGIASAGSWTLGTTAGANAVRATVGALAPVTFAATGTAGAVASLAVVSGGGQDGWIEEALAQPIVVKVTDAHGNAVAGVAVAFAATAGNGAPSAAQATTGASGEAQVTWTLGATEGDQALSATAGTVTAVVPAQARAGTLRATQLAVGNRTVCARTASEDVRCWGRNSLGSMANGTTESQLVPGPIDLPGVSIASVSMGLNTGCALATSGAAYCWGWTAIGDGTSTRPRLSPIPVTRGLTFSKLVVGGATVCALDLDGAAWCWGDVPHTGQRRVPTLVSPTLRFRELAVGNPPGRASDRACGIGTDGVTYCWANSGIGDPAQYSINPPDVPSPVVGGPTFASIVTAGGSWCGLTPEGKAYCWGENETGQLGFGEVGGTYDTPQPVAGGLTFASLSISGVHTCGITTDGAAYCWGWQHTGLLGNGFTETLSLPTPQPVAVPSGVRFASIVAGSITTCAIAGVSSDVYCWGWRMTSPTSSVVDAVPTPVRTR